MGGYVFKIPLVKDEPLKPKSDVELPPAVSSLGYVLEEENLYKDGPLRALLSSFAKAQKGAGRTKWVNSPNVYQKVEVLETGTPDPKESTTGDERWKKSWRHHIRSRVKNIRRWRMGREP